MCETSSGIFLQPLELPGLETRLNSPYYMLFLNVHLLLILNHINTYPDLHYHCCLYLKSRLRFKFVVVLPYTIHLQSVITLGCKSFKWYYSLELRSNLYIIAKLVLWPKRKYWHGNKHLLPELRRSCPHENKENNWLACQVERSVPS